VGVKNVIGAVVLATTLIIALIVALRRWYEFRGWYTWPTAEATVEAADVRSFKGNYFVDIGYSYAVNSSFVSGCDERSFSSEADASAYADGIRGRRVVIRFNPKNLERSRIDDCPVAPS
jgi:hypothetical protein